ncbi:MAG: pre-peptidase C-terminal domain-containing protein [Dokdonella sp.]|nr:pre-peptidase C-terminal domain-containing protein [Dokdonella sp.]MBP6326549.1 pre-peptidase C-terminal domain-containing protein [Dokdonella sp.]MBP6328526.1 pre-peptidase C-terminal domain-containing protein [Dokdonella sp.]MCC6440102.1 pre-peptidase C-terminal domain-containing protein [Rhodanobacteraceae bacterium]
MTPSLSGYSFSPTSRSVSVSGANVSGQNFTGTAATNNPPTAGFGFTSSGLTANFTDSSSDSDGTIASRSWNFGDGGSSTATNPSHTYASAGSYSVTLTVTDNGGATDSETQTVTVADSGNVLQNGVTVSGLAATVGNSLNYTMQVPAGASGLTFNMSGGTGDADLYVRFGSAPTDTVYDCRPYASGNSESCPIATAQAGTYYVRVKAYSTFSGVSLTGSYSLVGNVAPNADFSSTSSGLTANFTDTSTDSDGSIVSRAWNFGDGSTSTATNPSHAYASAGTYNVSLTVTDDDGATDSVTKAVTVSSSSCVPSGTVLCNGSSVSGLSASRNNWTSTYTLVVPAGATNLSFNISGGTGDADLYVRLGAAPTTSSYLCRPYTSGNTETCSFTAPTAGTYYVRLRAYATFSGVTLTTSYTP